MQQRLDFWLWCARVASSRGACQQIATSGLVRINRQPTAKAHALVRVGDVITVPLNAGVRVLKVKGFCEKRGDAATARLTYDEL